MIERTFVFLRSGVMWWTTLAEFEKGHVSETPAERRSDERLWAGTPAVRIERSRRDDRTGIKYEWMDVLTIVDRRGVLFTLRSLPPITPSMRQTFDAMISTYVPDP
jgi:hypothetical protein